MPDLLASLHPHDFGHFRIVAELWGLELESRDRDSAVEELTASMLDLELARETLDVLPAETRPALDALLAARGRIPWAEFARRFGEIREMGAGKRDREHPHHKPVSAAEALFYRGLIARAFFDTEKGAQEFAYIPDDLLKIINREARDTSPGGRRQGEGKENNAGEVLGRPATPVEKAFEIPTNDHILDDATTLLAALRVGSANCQFAQQLPALLHTAKILKKNVPQAEAVKKFLEAARPDALVMLVDAWKSSTTFDELRLIPSIACEGEWTNDPRETRNTLLNFLNALPPNQWWSFPAFLRDLKLKHPDFQRPAGDYDSWFIKRASDGQFLRGFAYWDAVDGALVRFVIQIMHWLGLVDLAAPEEGKDFTAFRLTFNVSRSTFNENGKIAIASNGKISISRYFSRAVRYQIARFCEWDDSKGDDFIYHVSAQSLKRATEQGLKAEQLLALLVKVTKSAVPPALVKALKRWEANGTEARAESQTILRVTRPEVLEELRKSKAARFLSEALGPTAVIVKNEAVPKIASALAELGVLLDIVTPAVELRENNG
ncbi:MAG: helicase-associated domain-containing protein [Chloroflexi bacterium]|nr:helicase-associated domain-containing protein [Chloroflexota bacterium]